MARHYSTDSYCDRGCCGCCSTKRMCILSSILFFLFLGAAAALAYFVVQYIQLKNPPADVLYPAYFRTPDQQRVFSTRSQKSRPTPEVVNTTDSNGYFCEGACYKDETEELPNLPKGEKGALTTPSFGPSTTTPSRPVLSRKRRQVEAANDGCCITTPNWEVRSSIVNVFGETKDVVSLPDQNKFQYIYTETCVHATGCNFCQCHQETTLTSVVTHSASEQGYDIDWTWVDGCCKCLFT